MESLVETKPEEKWELVRSFKFGAIRPEQSLQNEFQRCQRWHRVLQEYSAKTPQLPMATQELGTRVVQHHRALLRPAVRALQTHDAVQVMRKRAVADQNALEGLAHKTRGRHFLKRGNL